MKTKLLIFAFVTMSAFSAHARSLKQVMSQMGGTFKVIARPISSGNAGEAERAKVLELITLVDEAKQILPDIIGTLSSPQREEMTERYNTLMSELTAALEDLEKSISTHDVAGMKDALGRVLDVRTRGHDDFRI